MSTILQTFNYGSPAPKNAMKSDDKQTHGDQVNHPASEIFKAIDKITPHERIIIFVKDAALATIACEHIADITFRENNPEVAKEIQVEGIVGIKSEEYSTK